MLEAIDLILKKGIVSLQDAPLLRDLHQQQDYYLKAIWEAYTMLKDFDDLSDSVAILLEVAKENLKKKEQLAKTLQEQQQEAQRVQ